MLGAVGGTLSRTVTNSVFCRRPQSLLMRSCVPSASARKTQRWHLPNFAGDTMLFFMEGLTEQVFEEHTSENVECASFILGLFGLWQWPGQERCEGNGRSSPRPCHSLPV